VAATRRASGGFSRAARLRSNHATICNLRYMSPAFTRALRHACPLYQLDCMREMGGRKTFKFISPQPLKFDHYLRQEPITSFRNSVCPPLPRPKKKPRHGHIATLTSFTVRNSSVNPIAPIVEEHERSQYRVWLHIPLFPINRSLEKFCCISCHANSSIRRSSITTGAFK